MKNVRRCQLYPAPPFLSYASPSPSQSATTADGFVDPLNVTRRNGGFARLFIQRNDESLACGRDEEQSERDRVCAVAQHIGGRFTQDTRVNGRNFCRV